MINCLPSSEDDLERRGIAYDAQTALSAASVEVKSAMKDAVTTSIEEYKKIMDFFATRLKELFQKANFKGSKVLIIDIYVTIFHGARLCNRLWSTMCYDSEKVFIISIILGILYLVANRIERCRIIRSLL